MSDVPIPEDIRNAAMAVVERGYNEGLLEAVERAIMVERERCAVIAEPHIMACECCRDTATVIGTAIRRGTP